MSDLGPRPQPLGRDLPPQTVAAIAQVITDRSAIRASWDDDEPADTPTRSVSGPRSDADRPDVNICVPHICGRCAAFWHDPTLASALPKRRGHVAHWARSSGSAPKCPDLSVGGPSDGLLSGPSSRGLGVGTDISGHFAAGSSASGSIPSASPDEQREWKADQ